MIRTLLLLALVPATTFAQSPTPDLALVPGEAVGFLHVRVAEVWKTEAMKDVRKVIEKAGPEALAKLDTDFTPSPSTLDRVTLVVLPSATDAPNAPQLATILAFSKPFDVAKVKAAYLSKAVEKKAGGKTYFSDDRAGISVHFADAQTLVFSDSKMLSAFLELAGMSEGALKAATELAGKNQLTLALNPAKLPIRADDVKQFAPDLVPLLTAKRFTLTGNVAKETTLKASLDFGTAAEATAGDKAIRKLAEIGRQALVGLRTEAKRAFDGRRKGEGVRPLDELPEALFGLAGLGALNIVDEFLAQPPLVVADTSVTLSITLPEWASQYAATAMTAAGLALPAIQKVRNAAARMQSTNNLKQMALAMHNFESAYGSFPPAAIVDKKGKKLLSWRVQILPYIEQDTLYRQFKLDEPWDSEHNKKLIDKMPKIYADPRVEAKAGETYYKVFVGKEAAFDWIEARKITNFTDGTSNTIMMVAGGKPVVWTQPDDFEFDPKAKLLPDILGPFDEFLVAFADGSVRTIKKTVTEQVLKAMITAAGGEVIPFDDE